MIGGIHGGTTMKNCNGGRLTRWITMSSVSPTAAGIAMGSRPPSMRNAVRTAPVPRWFTLTHSPSGTVPGGSETQATLSAAIAPLTAWGPLCASGTGSLTTSAC